MRRKFSREFKIEAVKLGTKLGTGRGVAVARAAGGLDVAESVLGRWMRELTSAPVAFPAGRADMGGSGRECSAEERPSSAVPLVRATTRGRARVRGMAS